MASGTSRAWFLVPAAMVLLIVITIWSVQSKTRTRALYEGKEDVTVSLVAPGGGGRDAAMALVDRFVSIGIDAQILQADDHQLRLKLRRLSEPRATVAALLSPEPLQFQVIAPDQSTHLEDGGLLPPEGGQFDAGLGAGGEHAHPWLIGTSRAETLEKAQRTSKPPGEESILECIPGPDRKSTALCAAWLVEPPLPLTVKNVTEAHMGADKVTEEPLVLLRFDAEGAKVLEQVTREHAGQMLAVVAFGELAARPVMKEPITTGGLTFSTRTGDTDRATAVARAERIIAATKSKPLPPLVLQSIETEKPK